MQSICIIVHLLQILRWSKKLNLNKQWCFGQNGSEYKLSITEDRSQESIIQNLEEDYLVGQTGLNSVRLHWPYWAWCRAALAVSSAERSWDGERQARGRTEPKGGDRGQTQSSMTVWRGGSELKQEDKPRNPDQGRHLRLGPGLAAVVPQHGSGGW